MKILLLKSVSQFLLSLCDSRISLRYSEIKQQSASELTCKIDIDWFYFVQRSEVMAWKVWYLIFIVIRPRMGPVFGRLSFSKAVLCAASGVIIRRVSLFQRN